MKTDEKVEEICRLVREIAQIDESTVKRMFEYANWYSSYKGSMTADEVLQRISTWLYGLKEGIEWKKN